MLVKCPGGYTVEKCITMKIADSHLPLSAEFSLGSNFFLAIGLSGDLSKAGHRNLYFST